MSVPALYKQNAVSGSIQLGLDIGMFEHFPRQVNWHGVQLLKKSEFHVTLLHAKSHAGLSNISNQELASFFTTFVSKWPIALLSFTDDFRYVEEGEKKTLLVRCIVSHIEELFAALNRAFGTHLPVQPAHVTLYSLETTVGIHVNSEGAMARLERVESPELEEAYGKINLL